MVMSAYSVCMWALGISSTLVFPVVHRVQRNLPNVYKRCSRRLLGWHSNPFDMPHTLCLQAQEKRPYIPWKVNIYTSYSINRIFDKSRNFAGSSRNRTIQAIHIYKDKVDTCVEKNLYNSMLLQMLLYNSI